MNKSNPNPRAYLPLAAPHLGYKRHRPYYYLMRSLLFSLLVASTLAAPLTVTAQSTPTPASAKAKKASKSAQSKPDAPAAKPEESKHDYSQEAFVVEQFRSTYHFENDGTGRKETIVRIRVQSEAGVQQWGQIQVGYNSANERVEIGYVRVIKADGSVVKAGDDAVQDLSAPSNMRLPSTPTTARSTSPCPACVLEKCSNMTWSR